jgi:hypothetical protein
LEPRVDLAGLLPADPQHALRLIESAFAGLYGRRPDAFRRSVLDAEGVYHLQRELQALVDMWRATGNVRYLETARATALRAIDSAKTHPCPLIWKGIERGTWPCFRDPELQSGTGGHSQLADLQGSVGLLLVATALRAAELGSWEEIAAFVESDVIDKWMRYRAGETPARLEPAEMIRSINAARDARELMATASLELWKLGLHRFPYEKLARTLVDLYLDPQEPGTAPRDTGTFMLPSRNALVWYWRRDGKLAVQDTSHANRTAWLASRAHAAGLIDDRTLELFKNTFKHRIWQPHDGPFAFANFVDGTNAPVGRLGPNQAGNIWFGWHRLAAHDETLRDLLVALAHTLATDEGKVPPSQNRSGPNARLCLLAWGARLLAENGAPDLHP